MSPFHNLPNLSIQTTFFIPIASDQQGTNNGKPWLSHDGYQWWIQFYYDQEINDKFRAFFEADAFISIDRKGNSNNNSLLTPVKGFLSYFPTSKLTAYLLAEYGPTWSQGGINQFYTQIGLGGKYQLLRNLEIELLFTNFPIGKSSGAGTTYNLGFRFLK